MGLSNNLLPNCMTVLVFRFLQVFLGGVCTLYLRRPVAQIRTSVQWPCRCLHRLRNRSLPHWGKLRFLSAPRRMATARTFLFALPTSLGVHLQCNQIGCRYIPVGTWLDVRSEVLQPRRVTPRLCVIRDGFMTKL